MQRLLNILLISLLLPASAKAENDFSSKLDLDPLKRITVQHQQTLKTFDSFSRQAVSGITGRSKLNGADPVYTVLDMSFSPLEYLSKNVIKIRNVPLRMDLHRLESIDDAEKQRIVREGTVSLEFWLRPEVRKLMLELSASAIHKANAIQQVDIAATSLGAILKSRAGFPPAAIIPPATDSREDHKWLSVDELFAWAEMGQQTNRVNPLLNYKGKEDALERALHGMMDLRTAWLARDAVKANNHVQNIAQMLPQINPGRYPSLAKRNIEVVYNRLAKLTLPVAALYFVAFVLFLLGSRSGVSGMRIWGLRFFAAALLVHTLGIGIRWWLVAETHGNWFDGIPIKNQFESVLMSAWFGATIGFILELRKSRGIFGAAASFVGWLSLIALFAAPHMTNKNIGDEIGQVQGVLMSYWLYIHVTMVVAAYSLIAMGFALGVWWLVKYYSSYGTLSRFSGHQISSDSADFDALAISGGGVALSPVQTLARMLFMPLSKPAELRAVRQTAADVKTRNFLAVLDQCHLVIVQLAFWILGTGVVLGAVWADQSWGRPWGWDPKETFALVTWIVYLIVVHVRFVTEHKAWWTAVLSIVGFIVMLFNWIGVNFFLVGLHSYA